MARRYKGKCYSTPMRPLSLTRLFLTFLLLAVPALGQLAKKPKLVVCIVVDQFRYDYLTRFHAGYNGGIEELLTKGAVFTNAHLIHFPSVTAVGHATFLSGATPSVSGIIGNDWYDRASSGNVTSVSDPATKLLGADGAGSSPRRLLVSTVGDEMKVVQGQTKVMGISLKDRAAILPVGHMANGAYWFDNKSGNFVSSTYYFAELPGWVKDFNNSHPADKYAGAEWMGTKFGPVGEKLNESLAASPWGNELIESFAERAIQGEQLGQRGITDLLSVSFSSNDYVGHAVGPDAPEVQDMAFRTDLLFRKLFAFVESKVGMKDTLIVLTADHGVAPAPEVNSARKLPGGRLGAGVVEKAVQEALERAYGAGKWIEASIDSGMEVYLNAALIRDRSLDHEKVCRTAADALRALPHVYRVYTREEIIHGELREDSVGMRIGNGFYGPRGADVITLLEPYWLFGSGTKGTTHSTPFDYDTHIPVIFMGPGVKPGKYYGTIAMNDIAPTLSAMLGLANPAGSVGRILAEMFTKERN